MKLERGKLYVIRDYMDTDALAEFKGSGAGVIGSKRYSGANVFQILEENPDELFVFIGEDESLIIPLEEYGKWEKSAQNPSDRLYSELMRIQK